MATHPWRAAAPTPHIDEPAAAAITALALYDHRTAYQVGHRMLLPLPFLPSLCTASVTAPLTTISWFFRTCGAPPVARLPALPAASGPATRVDVTALVAVAYSALDTLSEAAQRAAAEQEPPAGMGAACAAAAACVIALRLHRYRRAAAAEAAHVAAEDVLTTPETHLGECSFDDEAYDAVLADEADSTGVDGHGRGSDPLVATPAVTRLLSFSRAASPLASIDTRLAYNVAAAALKVRRKRCFSRAACTAARLTRMRAYRRCRPCCVARRAS